MRVRAALAAAGLLIATSAIPELQAQASAAVPGDCSVQRGVPSLPELWPQKRLDYRRAWQVSRGAGIRVAVIDSGLNQFDPQMHMKTDPGYDVIGNGFPTNDVRDCFGHGTEVTSILAAQPSDRNNFAGVAPDVTIIPIKQTNTQTDKTGTAPGLAAAIERALTAKADVANISVTTANDSPQLKAAVAHAAERGMVIVAAAGNEGEQANLPAYPAAYSTEFPNVIAVSASDRTDQIAPFSETGSYVTVAAPGVGVPAIAGRVGYIAATGTSFATPYVTGTVALVMKAFPALSAEQVRNRIIATADAPPATVPSRTYGYGIVNPYLAVTTVRDDRTTTAPSPAARALPAPRPVPPADHHTRDVALGSAAVLLGLGILTVAAASVLRRRRRTPLAAG